MFGEAADFLLVPDLRAVDVYVEHAATALDHLGVHAEFSFDRLRQTGGRGVVVSLHAVFDTDVHANVRSVNDSTPSSRGMPPARRAGSSQIHGHQEFGVGLALLEPCPE